jgi:hypothetical protein
MCSQFYSDRRANLLSLLGEFAATTQMAVSAECPRKESQLYQPLKRPAHSCLVGPPKSPTILSMAGIGGGRLLGTALCGLFLRPPIPHHVRAGI